MSAIFVRSRFLSKILSVEVFVPRRLCFLSVVDFSFTLILRMLYTVYIAIQSIIYCKILRTKEKQGTPRRFQTVGDRTININRYK